MLNSVLKNSIYSPHANRFQTAIENFSIFSNSSKKKQRHHFIRPMRKANFTLKETRGLGFICSKQLWRSCIVTDAERNKGGRRKIRLLLSK